MPHQFVILEDGVLKTYNNYDDIPETFDNVIKFLPEVPSGPHSHNEHEEIEKWNIKLLELLKREK